MCCGSEDDVTPTQGTREQTMTPISYDYLYGDKPKRNLTPKKSASPALVQLLNERRRATRFKTGSVPLGAEL
jgi:hypothetical protein